MPQTGGRTLRTELGVVGIEPGETALIPPGIRFQVELREPPARGYVCENYGQMFALPELGPTGANGLEDRHGRIAG